MVWEKENECGFDCIVDADLSVVHQPWSAGFGAGQRVAGDDRQPERTALGRGIDSDADFILHDHFEPEQREVDSQIRHGRADGDFRRDDGAGAAGLFAGEKLCVFAADGRSARTGRGRGGRGTEQLRRAALRSEAHELAALLLGRGHDHRADDPLGGAAHRRELENGLSRGGVDAVRGERAAVCDAGHVEAERHSAGGARGEDAGRAGCAEAAGRKGGHDDILRLLRGRIDAGALGRDVYFAGARRERGDGGLLRRDVLHRHHGGTRGFRLYGDEAPAQADGAIGAGAAGAGLRIDDDSGGKHALRHRSGGLRAGLRADLSEHHTGYAGQLRRGKLAGGHWRTDGVCVCGIDVPAVDFRRIGRGGRIWMDALFCHGYLRDDGGTV